MELNTPPCLIHGSLPRPFHTANFQGIVDTISEIILTVSGVGTTSFTKCPYGYDPSFGGIVRALEDLNSSISGIISDASFVGGSGIYITNSGNSQVINANYGTIVSGGLVAGTNITFNYGLNNTLTVNSNSIVSGTQAAVYVQNNEPPLQNGALWFDTSEGRTHVYVAGSGWYQTNAEAIILKGDLPPSGTGSDAPVRDGLLWFNNLLGSIFVYDATTSGWYETGSVRTPSYSSGPPSLVLVEGSTWIDSDVPSINVWNGSTWVTL
jgi:hypothetical protein